VLNLKRLIFPAVVFLVVLRMCIGWQFFYEGLWKYQREGTAEEWSAAGYLSNARGPLRDEYRGLLDDPDDLKWLDYEHVDNRWTNWKERFVKYYGLTEEQQAELDLLLNGPKEFRGRSRFPEVAEGIGIGGSLKRRNIIRMERDEKDKNRRYMLIVNGELHLTPRERDNLMRMGRKVEDRNQLIANAAHWLFLPQAEVDFAQRQADLADAFQRALSDVYKRSSRLSYRERLTVLLKGDPERVTKIRDDQQPGSVDHKRPGKIDEYKQRLKRRDEMLSGAKQDFQHEHLNKEWKRISELRAELVGPVKKLEQDLQRDARRLLTVAQLEKGRVRMAPPSTIDRIDTATMWGLMVIGMLLIVGLFSRLSALAGGLLVLSFYLAMPPWPGLPPMPGPEHSLIVDKNLVEVLALFSLTFIPTGKYFGIDAVFIGLFGGANRAKKKSGRRSSRKRGSNRKSSESPSPASPAEKVVQVEKVAQSPPPPASVSGPKQTSADIYVIKSSEGKP